MVHARNICRILLSHSCPNDNAPSLPRKAVILPSVPDAHSLFLPVIAHAFSVLGHSWAYFLPGYPAVQSLSGMPELAVSLHSRLCFLSIFSVLLNMSCQLHITFHIYSSVSKEYGYASYSYKSAKRSFSRGFAMQYRSHIEDLLPVECFPMVCTSFSFIYHSSSSWSSVSG